MSSDEEKVKEMKALCGLITWLDGYANLSCVDPIKMDRAAKMCGDDIQGVWGRVRGDVYSIGKLPGESEKVVRQAKMVNTARIFLFGFVVLAILLFLLAAIVAPRLIANQTYSLILLVAIAVALNGGVFTYLRATRRLSSAVNEFYERNEDRARPERKRIRDATQALIDKLASRIRSTASEPEGYRFTLIDSGYANIRVTKEKGSFMATVNLGAR